MNPDPQDTLFHRPGEEPPAATISAALGQTFGDYDLEEEIARGGMGVVFRARQRSLRRPVALKLILAGELADPQVVRRFRAEAAAAAALDHPNILPIYEIGERFGQMYFSMKLIEGGTLAARVPELVADPAGAAALAARVARAVAYAHSRGIVHRDLKPANILMAEDGTPFVADFGLAKRIGEDDGLTQTGIILGSASYMAPEQARGEKGIGPPADIWAIGAILYELLTGRPPFLAPTQLDTILDVIERDPPHPRSLSRGADEALSLIALRCLEKDPERRYPCAADLADDLDRWSVGEPISSRRPNFAARVAAWARREPGLACRLAVLALCAAIVHLKFRLDPAVDFADHARILAILLCWAGLAIGCQALLRRDRYIAWAVKTWLVGDIVFLTGLLMLDESQESPLIAVYLLLVVASGLWFRVRLVWTCTWASVGGYVAMVAHAAATGPLTEGPHHHVIFVITLIAVGSIVAYQVRRARLMSRTQEMRSVGTRR